MAVPGKKRECTYEHFTPYRAVGSAHDRPEQQAVWSRMLRTFQENAAQRRAQQALGHESGAGLDVPLFRQLRDMQSPQYQLEAAAVGALADRFAAFPQFQDVPIANIPPYAFTTALESMKDAMLAYDNEQLWGVLLTEMSQIQNTTPAGSAVRCEAIERLLLGAEKEAIATFSVIFEMYQASGASLSFSEQTAVEKLKRLEALVEALKVSEDIFKTTEELRNLWDARAFNFHDRASDVGFPPDEACEQFAQVTNGDLRLIKALKQGVDKARTELDKARKKRVLAIAKEELGVTKDNLLGFWVRAFESQWKPVWEAGGFVTLPMRLQLGGRGIYHYVVAVIHKDHFFYHCSYANQLDKTVPDKSSSPLSMVRGGVLSAFPRPFNAWQIHECQTPFQQPFDTTECGVYSVLDSFAIIDAVSQLNRQGHSIEDTLAHSPVGGHLAPNAVEMLSYAGDRYADSGQNGLLRSSLYALMRQLLPEGAEHRETYLAGHNLLRGYVALLLRPEMNITEQDLSSVMYAEAVPKDDFIALFRQDLYAYLLRQYAETVCGGNLSTAEAIVGEPLKSLLNTYLSGLAALPLSSENTLTADALRTFLSDAVANIDHIQSQMPDEDERSMLNRLLNALKRCVAKLGEGSRKVLEASRTLMHWQNPPHRPRSPDDDPGRGGPSVQAGIRSGMHALDISGEMFSSLDKGDERRDTDGAVSDDPEVDMTTSCESNASASRIASYLTGIPTGFFPSLKPEEGSPPSSVSGILGAPFSLLSSVVMPFGTNKLPAWSTAEADTPPSSEAPAEDKSAMQLDSHEASDDLDELLAPKSQPIPLDRTPERYRPPQGQDAPRRRTSARRDLSNEFERQGMDLESSGEDAGYVQGWGDGRPYSISPPPTLRASSPNSLSSRSATVVIPSAPRKALKKKSGISARRTSTGSWHPAYSSSDPRGGRNSLAALLSEVEKGCDNRQLRETVASAAEREAFLKRRFPNSSNN